jgi:hypothetical protein
MNHTCRGQKTSLGIATDAEVKKAESFAGELGIATIAVAMN